MADDEVQLLQIGGGPRLEPRGVALGGVAVLLQLPPHVLAQLGLPLQCQRDELVANGARLRLEVLLVDEHDREHVSATQTGAANTNSAGSKRVLGKKRPYHISVINLLIDPEHTSHNA